MNNQKEIRQLKTDEVEDIPYDKISSAYLHWRELDKEIKEISGKRGINFPSELSEYLVCRALKFKINKEPKYGDAIDYSDKNNLRIIEIKASSSDSLSAPNSFSPKEKYHELIFARIEKSDDTVSIYETGFDSDAVGKIMVNEKQTLKDQQDEGKRPRFSVYNKIVKPNKIKPRIFDIITGKEITPA